MGMTIYNKEKGNNSGRIAGNMLGNENGNDGNGTGNEENRGFLGTTKSILKKLK